MDTSSTKYRLTNQVKEVFYQMDKPDRFFRFAVVIFGIALFVRLAVLLFFWSDCIWQSGHIQDDWNKLAINLVEAGTYGFLPDEPTVTRGPFFPLIEIPLYLVFGENYAGWSISLLLFDSLTCLFLMFIARRLWGNRPALLAGLFYSVNLPVVYYTAQIEQFTSIMPFVFLWFYLFSLWELRPFTAWLPWTLGLVSGLMIVNKTVYLPAPFLGAAAIILFRQAGTPVKRLIAQIVIYLLVTMAVVTPWTYRNYVVSKRFIPVQSYFWELFWQDIIISDLDARRGMNRPDGELLKHLLSKRAELFKNDLLSKELRGTQKELYEESVFATTVLKLIRGNPLNYFNNILNNMWQFWIGAENLNKVKKLLTMQAVYLGATLVGFCFLFMYRQVYRIKFGLLLILMLWGVHCLVFAWGRFSLDLVPILAIIFGLGFDTCMKNKDRRDERFTQYRKAD